MLFTASLWGPEAHGSLIFFPLPFSLGVNARRLAYSNIAKVQLGAWGAISSQDVWLLQPPLRHAEEALMRPS